MSKKKDRKIKRLQRLPIWSAIVGIIITDFVLFVLTVFICSLSIFGIINTLILNNAKECNAIIQYVNENWNKESESQLETRLSTFSELYGDIQEVKLIQGEIKTAFSGAASIIDTEMQKLFDAEGMIHFVNPEYEKPFLNGLIFDNKDSDSGEDILGLSLSSDLERTLYNPNNLIKSMDIERLFKDRKYLTQVSRESEGLHVISFYKTDIPGVNLCIKSIYRLNVFQFNLMFTVLLFMLVVMIASGVYEISRLISVIHERRRVNQLVTIDTVTGGYNKDYFIQKAGKEISRGRRKYAVVQLRLEKYRNYCTAYGLKQGENLLEELNSNIEFMLDKHEFVAHVEKSDFAIFVIFEYENELNERVRDIMNFLREQRNGQHLTFSAGICPVRSKTDDISFILTCAGVAVPRVLKINDEIVWFDASMKDKQVWERRIEDDMDNALKNNEFKVYLQPKYSTRGEKLSAAEALVRWIHPVLGFISPGRFIPLFEKNGFILHLDDFMLTEVSRLQAEWKSQGKKLVPISVNVSRAHFAEENLAEHICSIVDKFKVPHEYIELELTESAFFDDKAILLETIRKLKSNGFKVSMDDFGAGYSSLNSLKELPLDIIKLDAEFFRGTDDVDRSRLIVGETISLAKKLGMEIVAEGIETREQVDFLAEQNCDLIQGFYFSKPLPVEEFEQKAFL